MLFGDAGAATLIEKCNDQLQYRAGFRTDGSGFKAIIIPAGVCRNKGVTSDTMVWVDSNRRSYYDLYMNGVDVFNFSITQVPQLLNDYIAETGTTVDHFDSFVMHQANTYMLKQIAKRTSIPMHKVPISMDRYGNTSVASIPLTMADL